MQLTTTAFEDGGVIPDRLAFARPHPDTHVEFSGNRNPDLAWSNVPDGTRSLVLICHDPDVPSRPDDVNQEDREVPADLPRVRFVHWVLVDIPVDLEGIEEGAFSDGVTPRGKDAAVGPFGTRQGANDFVGWFAGDEEMAGHYVGYDGPAPPWNDSILHHYVFTLHALDVERLDVAADFTLGDVEAAMKDHILASASVTGTYTQNPRLR